MQPDEVRAASAECPARFEFADLKYVVGSPEVVRGMETVRPLKPFSDPALGFLNDLSRRLLREGRAFTAVELVQEWSKPFFHYHYKCQLMRGEQVVAEGEGSANSLEKKYRWRTVGEAAASEEDRARGEKEMRRTKDGRQYAVYKLPNSEIYDLVNTLLKMAQKRALVAATLLAVSSSDFLLSEEDPDAIGAEGAAAGGGSGADAADSRKGAGEDGRGPREAVEAQQVVIVGIKAVEIKEGSKNGKAYKIYKIHADDKTTYSTFDVNDGEAAQKALAEGRRVELGFTVDGRGYANIVKGGVKALEAGAAVDRIVLTCSAPAPAEWRTRLAGAGFSCARDGLTWTANETDAASVASEEAARESWCRKVETIAAGGGAAARAGKARGTATCGCSTSW
jgi:hypothetical protein